MGNTGHIKSTLKYFKETTKREVEQRNKVRRAGADSFLLRLIRSRKTNSENLNVREKDWNQRNNDGEDNTKESINIIDLGVRTCQFNNKVVMTVQTVDDIFAKLQTDV